MGREEGQRGNAARGGPNEVTGRNATPKEEPNTTVYVLV